MPGEQLEYSVKGKGEFLAYYVPDLSRDIVQPLSQAGHDAPAIRHLGGEAGCSDLEEFI